MASTRNNNTATNYNSQQNQYKNILDNYMYLGYHMPDNEIIPEIGTISSKRTRSALSNNFVDIESTLFGINSTNLVNPQQPIKPQLNNIPLKPYFYRPNHTILPNPIIINKNRPNLL